MKPGDLATFKDPAGRVMYGDGGYKVLSVGRVNVKVSCDVRFSPTGPWFHQEHRFPIAHVQRCYTPEEVAALVATSE